MLLPETLSQGARFEVICKKHGSLGIVAQAYLGLVRTGEVNLKWDVHRLKVNGPHELEIRPYKPEKWQQRFQMRRIKRDGR